MFQISETWARQPTTLIGLAVSLGSVALATMGKIDVATAGVVITSGLGLMGVDDNTEAGRDVRALVADGVAAATPGHLSAVLPKLVQDGVALALRGVNQQGGLTIRYGESAAPLVPPVPMAASQVTIEPPGGPGPGARVLPVLAICAVLGLPGCTGQADQRAAFCAGLGGTVMAPLPAAPVAAKR